MTFSKLPSKEEEEELKLSFGAAQLLCHFDASQVLNPQGSLTHFKVHISCENEHYQRLLPKTSVNTHIQMILSIKFGKSQVKTLKNLFEKRLRRK